MTENRGVGGGTQRDPANNVHTAVTRADLRFGELGVFIISLQSSALLEYILFLSSEQNHFPLEKEILS